MPLVDLYEGCARLVAGELVAFPTETVFGLGCDPRRSAAVAKLMEIKDRDSGRGVPFIIAEPTWIETRIAVEAEQVARERRLLQQRFWPGPLSLVVTLSDPLIDRRLLGVANSIAVRTSPSREAQQLAVAVGGALPATSANPHGAPAAINAEQALLYFPELPVVQAVAPDGERLDSDRSSPEHSLPSTLLDVRTFPFKVLRAGAIDPRALGCTE